MGRKQFISISILLLLTVSSRCIINVHGDVPVVLSFEFDEEDSLLMIEVRHLNPDSNHYVDVVQIDVGGEVESIDFSESQSSTTFIVEYSVAGDESIRARAHCNVHGWSRWGEFAMGDGSGGGIPGFTSLSVLLGILLSVCTIILLNSRKNG